MDSRFADWMAATGSDPSSVRSYVSTLGRIEAAYGGLDALFADDRLSTLLSDLTYSTADSRKGVPNPSRVAIGGDLYNGLASLRSVVNKYRQFRDETDDTAYADQPADVATEVRTFTLERDLQMALRNSITQLEKGLAIIDGGVERTVPSGKIDILAQDAEHAPVVIELKAVPASRDAVGQIASYMGDIAAETGGPVRGMLVAPGFDHKASSAASMVPGLRLVAYTFDFAFTPIDGVS
jgi:hypothetical protein